MLEFKILSTDTNSNVYNTLVIQNSAYSQPQMDILVDTGSYIPIWTKGLDLFRLIFPDCVFMDAEAILSGFGKDYEVFPIYKIPEYDLTDASNNTVCIKDLYIAVGKKDFSFSMILGFPIFRKMNFDYKSYMYKQDESAKSLVGIEPIFRLMPHGNTYFMKMDFQNVTNEVLNVLERKYPKINKRLTQKKIYKKALIFAQSK